MKLSVVSLFLILTVSSIGPASERKFQTSQGTVNVDVLEAQISQQLGGMTVTNTTLSAPNASDWFWAKIFSIKPYKIEFNINGNFHVVCSFDMYPDRANVRVNVCECPNAKVQVPEAIPYVRIGLTAFGY